MPYTNPFTAVNDGDPMSALAVNIALESARDYVSDGIDSALDIADHSLDTEDIYRPETYGFPLQGTIGTTQQVYSSHRGNGERLSPVHFVTPFVAPWCYGWTGMPSPTRVSIYPALIQPPAQSTGSPTAGQMVVPHMARRVWVGLHDSNFPDTFVQLFASWHYIVLGEMEQDGDSAFATPKNEYPNPSASPEDGAVFGSFVLAYRQVGEVAWIVLPSTRRVVYPQEAAIDYTGIPEAGGASQTLNEYEGWGETDNKVVSYMPVCHEEAHDAFIPNDHNKGQWYDFALLYDRETTTTDSDTHSLVNALQIVVGVRNLLVEIFPG